MPKNIYNYFGQGRGGVKLPSDWARPILFLLLKINFIIIIVVTALYVRYKELNKLHGGQVFVHK